MYFSKSQPKIDLKMVQRFIEKDIERKLPAK
jgi:hypothetical protein